MQNQEFADDIKKHRRLLANLFASLGEAFGFTILHRIHVGNQLFLQSWTKGEGSQIELDYLRFGSIIREIQMGTIQMSHLFSVKKHNLTEQDDDPDEQPKKKPKKKTRNQKGNTVRNNDVLPDCSLKPNEKFGNVFHPEVKKAFKGKPPTLGGEEICQKYHSMGVCHDECKFKGTHKILTGETANNWRKFCLFCKDEMKRRNNNGK